MIGCAFGAEEGYYYDATVSKASDRFEGFGWFIAVHGLGVFGLLRLLMDIRSRCCHRCRATVALAFELDQAEEQVVDVGPIDVQRLEPKPDLNLRFDHAPRPTVKEKVLENYTAKELEALCVHCGVSHTLRKVDLAERLLNMLGLITETQIKQLIVIRRSRRIPEWVKGRDDGLLLSTEQARFAIDH